MCSFQEEFKNVELVIDGARQTMHDDGQRPMAIGQVT